MSVVLQRFKRFSLCALFAIALTPHSFALSWIEENLGQTSSSYDFIVRARDLTALTSNTHIDLLLTRPASVSAEEKEFLFPGTEASASAQMARVRLKLVGANKQSTAVDTTQLKSTSNYFKGSKDRWISQAHHYSEVRYQEVYPGIDVIYRLNDGRLEYDFIVSPGADSTVIALALDGVKNTSISDRGVLEAETSIGNLTQTIPAVYQIVNGSRQPIDGEFQVKDNGHIGFALAQSLEHHSVVIDPVIEFSGYFGGNRNDDGRKLQQKPNGNYVLLGETTSLFDPVVDPTDLKVTTDVFLAELDKDTGGVLWVTVLGGRRTDASQNFRVDSEGNSVIVGYTSSTDYPTVNAFQPDFIGNNTGSNSILNTDGFVSKLSADGSSLIFSTYLGGTDTLSSIETAGGFEYFRGIDLDADNNIYIVGQTAAPDFPVTTTFNGIGCYERELNIINPLAGTSSDITLSKISPAGTLMFSTCLGGSARDAGRDVRVESDGSVYVAGFSRSSDFPVTGGAFQSQPLAPFEYTPFVLRLSPDLTTITMASLVGEGFMQMIDVDAAGDVYGVAQSRGLNFATPGAFQQVSSDTTTDYSEGYVFKLSADGTTLIYGTYLGAEGADSITSINVDDEGRAYVAGSSSAPAYPLKNPLEEPATPLLRNADLWFPSSGYNHIARGELDNSETVFSLLSKDGTNQYAVGDRFSLGQVVPFFPDGAFNTAAMAYSQSRIAPGFPPAYVVAANRNGPNDIYKFDEQDFVFENFGAVGGADQISTSVVADVITNIDGFPNFYIGNYGEPNTLVQAAGVPHFFTYQPTGRPDGNTTAVAKLSLLVQGSATNFIAVANEFQDIRLYNATSTTLGQAIILPFPVGPVTAMTSGDIDGDGVQELVIASADRPVEVVRFSDSGVVASVDLLVEANSDNLSLLIADVDDDDDQDILVGRLGDDRLFLNDGSGNFNFESSYNGNVQATEALTPSDRFGVVSCPCFAVTDQNPQEILGSAEKIVLSVLNPDGTDLEFSSYLGSGGSSDLFRGTDFAPNSDSKILLAGSASGDAWPLVTASTGRFESNDAVFMVLELDQDSDNLLDGSDNCTTTSNVGQEDTDADGYGNACDADFNNDCAVNFLDISAFANQFLSANPLFDLNSDGAVNFIDFSIVSTRFLQPPGPGLGDCALSK